MLDDPTLRAPFGHALVLVVFFSVLPVVLGLALAGVLSRVRLRGLGFFRTVLFLPQVVAMVVVGIAWSRDLRAHRAAQRHPVRARPGRAHHAGWLGDPTWALPAVGLVGTWVGTGLCVVLFLAGLSKVPREQYEAARLDGAGPVREFLAVGLPALRGEIAVAVTLTVIAALRTFDLVYVMTSGGPGGRTRVPAYEVYDRAFLKGEVGSAATVARRAHAAHPRDHRRDQPVRGAGDRDRRGSSGWATYAVLALAAAWSPVPAGRGARGSRCSPTRIGASGVTLANFGTAWTEGEFGTLPAQQRRRVRRRWWSVATVLSSLAGYAFGTMRFPGATALFYLLLVGLMVPSEAVVIPLYFTFSVARPDRHLLRADRAADRAVAGVRHLLDARLLPQQLARAGRGGAARRRRPLAHAVERAAAARPARDLTMVLLIFMWTWNEFLIPLVMVINERSLRTAPLGLSLFQGQYTSGTALLAAGAVLVALPVVVVYLFLQRHFIRGMLEGAVKG